VASFVEAVCSAVHAALAADETLVGLVGTASQILRTYQPTRLTPPCVLIKALEHELPVEGADELRQVKLALHCYARATEAKGGDFAVAEIADRVVALLHHNLTLTYSGYIFDLCEVIGAFGNPIWSAPEQAFRIDLWTAINLKQS